MIKNKKEIKNTPSELRMDLVSNDWVVIATGRARRPETFAKHNRIKDAISSDDCFFCKLEFSGKSVISYPNDYPALAPNDILNERKQGPNRVMDGIGYHEVIITADHQKQMALFSIPEVKMVIDLYQKRYLELMKKKFIKYISIFHNHGKEAGASMSHPHSQLLAIPVIDPDLRASVDGADNFYKSQGKCVYCTMIEWELKDKKRIVYENDKFLVVCPFASKASFEVRVYPKDHQSNFESMNESEKELFADAMRIALNKIYIGLNDPAYNFYFNTAPCDGGSYDQYHWHLNILPKTSIWAGFELGAGIEISTIEPEKAAEFLRKIK